MIGMATKFLFQLRFGQQCVAAVAQRLVFVLPFLEMIELMRLGNAMHIAPGEIAIDLVLRDALFDQALGLLRHVEATLGVGLGHLCFKTRLARRKPGADLPAIAAGSAESNGLLFQHHDLMPALASSRAAESPV